MVVGSVTKQSIGQTLERGRAAPQADSALRPAVVATSARIGQALRSQSLTEVSEATTPRTVPVLKIAQLPKIVQEEAHSAVAIAEARTGRPAAAAVPAWVLSPAHMPVVAEEVCAPVVVAEADEPLVAATASFL